MGMNIMGVLFKAPINNEEKFIEDVFSSKVASKEKAHWGDGYDGGLFSDDEILVYQKNGATNIYFDGLPPSTKLDNQLYNLLKKHEGVYYALGETAMAFTFLFYNEDGSVEEDSYLFEEVFSAEGNNKLNLTENDDIIHDGLFDLQDKYLGGTTDEDEITIYKLAALAKEPLNLAKNNDEQIEEYYRLILKNTRPEGKTSNHTLELHSFVNSLPYKYQKLINKGKPIHKFHSKIKEWKAEVAEIENSELKQIADRNFEKIKLGKMYLAKELILNTIIEEKIQDIELETRAKSIKIFDYIIPLFLLILVYFLYKLINYLLNLP